MTRKLTKNRKLVTKRRGVKTMRVKSDLIARNEGLVHRLVDKRLRMMGAPGNRALRDELHQVGRIALWRSARRHNPRKGKLTTLAGRHIEGAIGRALKRQGPVHVPERSVRKLARAGTLPSGVTFNPNLHARSSTSGIGAVEARLRLRGLERSLPARDRKLLSYLRRDLPKRDIAKRLGVSPGRVSQMLAAMRKRARKAEDE